MLFFSTICVFFYAFPLHLRGDFSLRLQTEDMGKKAQSDFLYHWNTDFTFGFQMPFSIATIETTSGSSKRLSLPFWKFVWCWLQFGDAVTQTEFCKRHASYLIYIYIQDVSAGGSTSVSMWLVSVILKYFSLSEVGTVVMLGSCHCSKSI